MATELAVGYVTLLPSMKGFQGAVEKALGKTDAPAKKQGQAIGQKMSNGITSALKTGAKVAGGAALAGIGTALVKGFGRLTAIDSAKQKLLGLGHSGKTVSKIMANANKAVKGTAFGLDEAATTAAGAVAAGIKPGQDLERTLALVADAATIAGTDMGSMGSIFNKVAATGKLQGDVIAQLNDAGVPVLQFVAKEMGVTAEEAAKMASRGEVSFDTFRDAMESGLGGAAQKSGDTFKGAWANALAAVGRVGANLLSGIFPQMKNGLSGLTEALGPVEDNAKKVGKAIGDVVTWLRENIVVVKIAAGVIGGIVAAVVAWRVAMAAATFAMNAWKVITAAWSAVTKISTAVMWAFNAAMSANPIMLVVLAVAALIAGLVWFFTQTKLGQEIWANFTQFLGEAWANFSAGFKIVIDAIAQWWNDLWSGIVSFFQTMWAGFQVLFQAGVLAFQLIWETVLGVIQTVWDAVWGGIKSFFVGIWNFIVAFVTTYITIVKTIITTVINVIMTVWSAVWGGIKSFFTTIWNGIVTGVKTYINTVRTIITTVVNVVKKVWSSVWGGISSFFSGIWNGIVSTVSKFSGTFKKVFGGIKGFVTSAFKGVIGVVKAPINGIIGLINGAIGALNNLSVTIPDWVPIVGGQTWGLSLPTIPKLASGAIVNTSPGGSLVNVGEGRYDEAVVPLGGPQFAKLADALAQRTGGTGQATVNQYIYPQQDDPVVQMRQWGREASRGLATV